MLGETLAAWVAFPIVAVALAVGLSLLLERVTGHRLGPLRVPVGLCAAVCLTLAVYWVDATGLVAVGVVAVPAAAGIVLEREELLRWRPSWFTLGWLAAYTLHMGPVLLSGGWTWTGYNFVNDTAVQLLLADWLPQHGVASPEVVQPTTATEFLRVYLLTAYPLGTHALLGTLGELVPAPLAALYQPYIAVLAASAGTALAQLVRRAGVAAPAAAAAGAVAVGANLFYQYALQGNAKEVGFLMALAAAAAAGRELIGSERPLRASVAAALCFAAAFEIYSAAAAPYLLALGVALAVGALVRRERASIPRLAKAGVALTVCALVLAAPGLAGAVTFNRIASGTFSGADKASDLGHLERPLELIQAAGVWLTGDYRVPVPTERDEITVALCVLIGILIVVGAASALRRREPGPLLLMATTAAAAVYLLPRLSPYASGKVLALASPVAVLLAAFGACAVARRSTVTGVVLAAAVTIGVVWSDALAYHVVRLAPIERLEALEDAGRRLSDQPGLVLVNEPEEFAKNYEGGANFNTSTEAITPRQIQLRNARNFQALHFDLDEQLLEYVLQFEAIVKRRAPDSSRPPANFSLTYRNRWYETWIRHREPTVLEHLPLQWIHRAVLKPKCSEVRALARRAEPGEVLVASRAPEPLMLDTATARRSSGWPLHAWQPGMVTTFTPGTATGTVRAHEPGRYRARVAGSLGRPIEVRIDGERVGSAHGVNNLGQWLPAGEVSLNAGRHRLMLVRRGGGFAPGDGFLGDLGPLALERVGARPSLHRVPPGRARELCGKAWDWIERVRP